MDASTQAYGSQQKGRQPSSAANETGYRQINASLKSTLRKSKRFGALIGQSKAMQEVYDLIIKVAPSDANVHIFGESGTGKELVARTIHELSLRHKNPFVPVNCGAIPKNLMENEFFGHRKGAFTGAGRDYTGYLQKADGGTLFLDEVSELDVNMQVKLLRAIDDGGFMRVGGGMLKKPDLRIISASNRDLRESVRQGAMRDDFFYRTLVLSIELPPLRERGDDLLLLVEHFSRIYSEGLKEAIVPEEVIQQLRPHYWPGNVRELQNVIQRFLIFKNISFLNPTDTPPDFQVTDTRA